MSNRCKMKGIVICGRPWAIRLLLCVAFLFSYISLLKISAQEQSYDQFFMEAMVQRQKGNNDAVFDLLRHCLEIRPDAAEAWYYISQYYSALKNADKAMACIKRAAELSPGNETYMETLAQAYIRQQDYANAIAVIEGLYERNKDQEGLLEMLFQLYQQENDYAKAIRVLERMEQIDGKSERLSVAKSEIYTRMGNKKAAVAEIAALSKQYPNDLNYMVMYGETLMMNGQLKRALGIYDRVLKQEPDNNRVLLSLRTYHQALGHTEVADSLTKRVLLNRNATTEEKVRLLRQEISANEAAGGDSTHILNLFRMMLAQPLSDTDMAVLYASYMNAKRMPRDSIRPVLEKVLEMTPDNAAARLQLVGYAWDAEDMDRVISLCQDARQYNPDEMAFYYYQGIAYYKKDNLDGALSAFQNGIGVINEESDPMIVSDFYAVMGDVLHQKGMAQEAFAAYDSCLQWKADNFGCLNNYAYYLSERGEQLDKAEEMSYKTVKAEPKNATYLDTYAWILFMQERYTEAKIYIDQALQNMEDTLGNAVIIEHAGDIYAQNKDMDRALSLWRDAQQQKPDDPLLNRKIKLKKYLKE
ncbi:Lipopolysaccharide biosynthesis regulator YciM, contains six TPR domains and a predicted metal-binding C-terminal domain [Prevotella aff. ruminicola Tc2-24]|uniref:Lipopolysaccharide biosynthesis regulator YciM, contains six TPR domains and a predicted metal-binding C-terminal domain n=2 Tax=Prevotella aff. ruminicola Tc2-24 TaxID=81582 RepID=A0A1I0Q8E1_9BACT|nr:Lipopolysaccharide biosynthesis regulator YciM, contains six TPR domains and a predicted metal-binding C-terminal domain [Prevotella aff. ruminicola Tc2-24]